MITHTILNMRPAVKLYAAECGCGGCDRLAELCVTRQVSYIGRYCGRVEWYLEELYCRAHALEWLPGYAGERERRFRP